MQKIQQFTGSVLHLCPFMTAGVIFYSQVQAGAKSSGLNFFGRFFFVIIAIAKSKLCHPCSVCNPLPRWALIWWPFLFSLWQWPSYLLPASNCLDFYPPPPKQPLPETQPKSLLKQRQLLQFQLQLLQLVLLQRLQHRPTPPPLQLQMVVSIC